VGLPEAWLGGWETELCLSGDGCYGRQLAADL
jgi:hypothetical protein